MYSCSDGPDFDPPPFPDTQRGVTCVRNISPPVQRQDASPRTISKSGVPMRSSADPLRRPASRSEPSIEHALRICATDPVRSSVRKIQRTLDLRPEPSIERALRFCATDPVRSSVRKIQRTLDLRPEPSIERALRFCATDSLRSSVRKIQRMLDLRSEPSIERALRFCATDPLRSSVRNIQRALNQEKRLMEMIDAPALRALRQFE